MILQSTAPNFAAMIALIMLSTPSLVNSAPPTPNTPATDDQAREPGLRFEPVTISGRALTSDGQPVIGARVFLGSASGGHALVAETKTDAQGNYRFNKASLPIERSDRAEGHDRGSLEVFAWSENFGLAWRSTKDYYPDGLPALYENSETIDGIPNYAGDDKIVQDITFSEPTRLSGRVTDQDGTPYISRYRSEAIMDHEVAAGHPAPLQIAIEPAATIVADVVDSFTGNPIADVDFWIDDNEGREVYMRRSWKMPNLSSDESPRTDAKGRVRLFVEPGVFTVGPGHRHSPAGYQPENNGVRGNCEAGKVYPLLFKLKRY